MSATAAAPWQGLPIFDAHLHILDPRFPPVANRGFLPAPFGVADYRRAVAGLDPVGGAVVAGSFQGLDQGWLVAALAELGPGFVGVAQLPAGTGDAEILRLHGRGVRAVRFNLYRGTAPDRRAIERLARRVHDLAGWHAELYLDATLIPELAPLLKALPRIAIDHLGLTRAGLPHLLGLVERGARVKASGFGRLDRPAGEALAAIHGADPGALLFGTDLPSTRAPRPFELADLDLLAKAIGDPAALGPVLCDNALAFYGERP
jgi:predicted TIM-barrel fold metal-dependent hydrolase